TGAHGSHNGAMRELQRQIIDALRVRPEINPAAEVEARIGFLVDYLGASGASGLVLGLSGGVDSTLAGRLAQLAVERVRERGGDAVAALEFVAADESMTLNVGPAVDAFAAEYSDAAGVALTDFTKGNTKARHRMVAQYALAGDRDLLVVGADQAAENVTGFFTKY